MEVCVLYDKFDNMPQVHKAVMDDNVQALKDILDNVPEDIERKCGDKTPFLQAILCKSENCLKYFLSGQVSPNIRTTNFYNEDAVIHAVKAKNYQLIRKMVPILGTNQTDRYGNSLGKLSVIYEDLKLMEVLKEVNYDFLEEATKGPSLAYTAIYNNKHSIFEYMLTNIPDAFINSCQKKSEYSVIEIMLEKDCRLAIDEFFKQPNLIKLINVPLIADSTMLHLAVRKNHTELANKLIQHGANINQKDKEGNTPLAIVKTKLMAKILLDHGADAHRPNYMRKFPFQTVESNGRLDIALFILAILEGKRERKEIPPLLSLAEYEEEELL